MKVCSVCRRCYDDSAVSCGEECYAPLSETQDGSPEMIAGYRLDSLLESGVKGRLFRARQVECDQSCLIKVLSADEVNSRRFLDEAKIAAAFFHPNLADVYEFGSLESGKVFVVAEAPDGQTLREVLDSDGAPTLLTTIQIARQMAEALHAIHLKGLLHRAFSPENIILTTDHENELLVRIRNLDYGGVVERAIISNKFLIDSALDSIRYFAPEQCSGDGASVQTDVYSLGIVLYEMLAGAPPFDAVKATGLIEKHRNQQPPEIKIANFDLRMLLTHTLAESLQKKPQMRQPSANTFARQIRHMEQLATHVSTPPPAGAVPIAPVRSAQLTYAATATAVSYVSQPISEVTPVVEPEKIIETRPLAAKTQERTEAPEPLVVETFESPVVSKDESESVIKPEISTEPLPEFENNWLAKPQAADFDLEESKPAEKGHWLQRQISRLKLHRKRLHSKPHGEATERPPAEIQDVKAFTEIPPEPIAAISIRKPTPVEWNQPEDDIPSVADVMEVLSKEQIVPSPLILAEAQDLALRHESAVETEPEQALLRDLREPTLIERNQSEESIPSVAEVLPTQQVIPIPLVPVKSLELATDPASEPAIEMEPELAAAVVEVLPTEQIVQIPLIHAEPQELSAHDSPACEPEPEQAAAVIEALPAEHIIPFSFSQTEPQALEVDAVCEMSAVKTEPDHVAITGFRKPTFIELERSDFDVPSGAGIQEFLSKDKLTQNQFVQTERRDRPVQTPAEAEMFEWGRLFESGPMKNESPAVLLRQQIPQVTTVQTDTEEITLVRPPLSRFTVDLEGSKAVQGSFPARRFSYRKPADTEFFPTLLENPRRRKASNPDAKDVMFSAYYGKPSARFSASRVALSGIVGLTLVAGAFMFGGDLVTKYLQASGPGSPEAAITKPSLVESKKTVSSSRKKGVRTLKKSRPDTNTGRTLVGEKSTQNTDSTASTETRNRERQSSGNEPTRPRVIKTPAR